MANLKTSILICIGLVWITLAAYWSTGSFQFINFDDNVYVYDNGHVQSGLSWNGVQWAFSADSSKVGHWHPITWLSLMLDYKFFGLNPSGYHLMNLLFHILNTILLFLIFHRMTKALWQSAFVAALFAIHPLHVESVAWVTERKDVLSTFFWMLTMGAYVFYVEHKTFSRYFIILVLFTVGLMSKAMLVTLPFVLVLLDYWPLNRFQAALSTSDSQGKWSGLRKVIVEKLPLFALTGVFTVIPYLAAQKANAVLSSLPLDLRIENALRAYVIYIWKMIWPQDLAVFYPYSAELPIWQILVAVITLTAITLFTLWMRKRLPFFIVGWLWYLGTLLPVIGIIQAGQQAYADRYTYIPLIGIFIMLCWTVPLLTRNLPYHRTLIGIGGGIVLAACIVISQTQVNYWQDSDKLMTHALEVTQNNYVAQTSLGIVLMKKGQTAKAMSHFEEAIRINPLYAYAQNNLGLLLSQQGRTDAALAHLNAAIRINPNYADAYSNLADLFRRTGRIEDALVNCRKAIEIDPYHADAYAILGAILARQGSITEATDYLTRAIHLKPNLPEAHLILAILFMQQGKLDEAAAHLKNIIQIKPDVALAHYYLGLIAEAQGNYHEAIQHFQDTLRIQPDFEKAQNSLNKLRTRQG
jgi:tetratricopeptide (TPR) repeat protein